MKRLFCFLIFWFPVASHAAFTEFYISNTSNTASDINAGDGKPLVSAAGGWTSALSSFTATAGTPFSGSNVGDFASVYVTGVSSTSYEARITSILGGGAGLILSNTALAGTAPTSSASSRSCTVGGYWSGPNGSTYGFPFNFVNGALIDTAGDTVRVNVQGGANYVTSFSNIQGKPGPVRFEGYTNTPGDGGYATFGTGVAISPLAIISGGTDIAIKNFIFYSTSTTGSNPGFNMNTSNGIAQNIIVTQATGYCIGGNGSNLVLDGIDVSNCNQANNTGGIGITGDYVLRNAFIHDINGTNAGGAAIKITNGITMLNTVVFNITGTIVGFSDGGTVGSIIYNSDITYTGGDCVALSQSALSIVVIKNSNFGYCGGYGINGTTSSTLRVGIIDSIGFFNNTSGDMNNTGVSSVNTFDYPSDPWINSSIGNFNLKSPLAIGTGTGNYIVSGSTITSLQSYPNIGAIQGHPFPGGASVIQN